MNPDEIKPEGEEEEVAAAPDADATVAPEAAPAEEGDEKKEEAA